MTLAPATVEFCQRAADLLYDMTWAAVCHARGDGSTDCTLPDADAAGINILLGNEERRCLAAERMAAR